MGTLAIGFLVFLLTTGLGALIVSWLIGDYLSSIGIYRSTKERKLAGICGGFAEAITKDAKSQKLWALIFRLSFVFAVFVLGASVFLYIFLWIFMKEEAEKEVPEID